MFNLGYFRRCAPKEKAAASAVRQQAVGADATRRLRDQKPLPVAASPPPAQVSFFANRPQQRHIFVVVGGEKNKTKRLALPVKFSAPRVTRCCVDCHFLSHPPSKNTAAWRVCRSVSPFRTSNPSHLRVIPQPLCDSVARETKFLVTPFIRARHRPTCTAPPCFYFFHYTSPPHSSNHVCRW
jgi:hypothetical protein